MTKNRTEFKWWVRNLIVPVIGGGGLVTLLVALLSRPAPVKPEASTVSAFQSNQATTQPGTLEPQDAAADVEKLVSKWLAAWICGRPDEFVALASEPFYFDQKVVLTKTDLRSAYESLRREKGDTWRKLEVQSIKVQTARELQSSGHDLSKDRIFGSLNLTLDAYTAAVSIKYQGRTEGMLVVVRRAGDRYEVVGVWD
jgi:hypothetical protein